MGASCVAGHLGSRRRSARGHRARSSPAAVRGVGDLPAQAPRRPLASVSPSPARRCRGWSSSSPSRTSRPNRARSYLAWGPNWDDDLEGAPQTASFDPNIRGELEESVRFEYEMVFMMYLPRICERCLNPSCVASCPSGAMYKREEEGIVLVDQEQCRGWRYCVSGCPYYSSLQRGPASLQALSTSAGQHFSKKADRLKCSERGVRKGRPFRTPL